MPAPRKSADWRFPRFAMLALAALLLMVGLLSQLFIPADPYTGLDLSHLDSFPLDPTHGSINSIPARFRALDGKKIRVTGFMWGPTNKHGRVNQFQLIYNLRYSHLPPTVQGRIFATSSRGVAYVGDAVDVYGTFHVNVVHDPVDGTITSVFQLDVDKIDPLLTSAATRSYTPWSSFEEVASASYSAGGILLFIALFRELLLLIRQIPSRLIIRKDICPVCGYDVRASPRRCPECGTRRAW